MKAKRSGEAFEDSFRASIPRGVHVRRLRTPTAMGFVVPQLVKLIGELCAALRRPVPEFATRAARFRFTPRSGVDFLMTAPTARGDNSRPYPVYAFALELKSVEGGSLPFAKVDEHQEKDLREAAEAGHVAGLVIEYRMHGEVWFVPIDEWDRHKAAGEWKSLAHSKAREIGTEIKRDLARGRTKTYWDVREWLLRGWGVRCEEPTRKQPPIEDSPLFRTH